LNQSEVHALPVTLTLTVPVFNEAETIAGFLQKMTEVFAPHPAIKVDFVFVNDGSTDETLSTLLACQQQDARITVVDLSRNFGKEAAMTAGLNVAQGQVVVPIDVDLQDPPEVILEMLQLWQHGFEVVLGRRINRDSDSWAKRTTASWFYKIHNKISKPKLPENVGDFRLMDRVVVDALLTLPEAHRFMKGLFAWVGFRTALVDYVRLPRSAGTTKFNGWSLWNFALEGLTSFSTEPLRIWTYVGMLVSGLSILFACFIIIKVALYGADVPGYASLIVAVTFLSGLQLVGIGILGEYLGRTYIESKRRPVYLVRRLYTATEK